VGRRPYSRAKIIQLNRQKEAIKQALTSLQQLPVRQIVLCVEFSDRPEEVIFYGNPKKIFQLLALAQFQIGFRFPFTHWQEEEKGEGE
jgi:hypothetical protein